MHQNTGYYINLIKAVAVSACIKLSLQPQTFAEVEHLINMLLNYWVIGWLIVHNACAVLVLGPSDMSDILRPPQTVAHQAPLSMESRQAGILEWVAMSSSRGSSQPEDWTQVSFILGGSFTIWTTREAQDYCMGSLPLFQGIFPIQRLTRGLLHLGQIPYQLSCQGRPLYPLSTLKSLYHKLSYQGSLQRSNPWHI